MKANQRISREREAAAGGGLLGEWWTDVNTDLTAATVTEIDQTKAAEIVLRYCHPATMPQAVTRCFGFFHDGVLAGACVFAERPGSNLLSHATSDVPADALYLARGACVHWAHPHAASWFLTRVGRLLAPCSIIAYSDPATGEVGTIYQALGWWFLGAAVGGPTAARVDGRVVTMRSFRRDRGYQCGQAMSDFAAAFPRSTVTPIGRKGRYLGAYGDRRFRAEVRSRVTPLPYPKRRVTA